MKANKIIKEFVQIANNFNQFRVYGQVESKS